MSGQSASGGWASGQSASGQSASGGSASGQSSHRAAPIRVLFVCTGNSARSQMAEALLRRAGGDAFEVFSAGTDPTGVNPLTVRALADVGIDISGARSKSVTEFLDQRFDFVVTVCDRARESCPNFPGEHDTLHWGLDDPAEATGTEEERLVVFRRVLGEINQRIRTFVPVALGSHGPRAADSRTMTAR